MRGYCYRSFYRHQSKSSGIARGDLVATILRALALLTAIQPASTCLAQTSGNGPGEPVTAAPADKNQPGGSDAVLSEAQSFLQRGLFAQADKAVRRYLEKNSSSANAHYLLGYALFKEIKPKDSLAEYTAAAKYRVPSAFDLKVVALDYVLLHDYMDADKWLTRSIEFDPKDYEAWYYLGRTKYNENRFQEAINAFDQCLKLSPENVKAEDNLGLSYAGLGQPDKAIAAYKKAIAWQEELVTKNPGPYLDMGTVFLEQNRAEEAIPYLRQAAQISPDDPKVHEQLGKALQRLNQLPQAQRELERAVELAPQNAALHFVLGQVYRKQGFMDRAKVEFDQSARLSGSQSSGETP